ncbi:MAG: 4Fe-4S dicluster domain-containing protein [Firmicutes bacterium]|nr:4Fe-4S dicluster domain-containing protein [Bacillota bacterium]MCL5058455.1 4Fe-4S dicluster domain-containing protein [Actinomycetota bacterium]
MGLVNPDFTDRVNRPEGFNAAACMNCGVCSAVCPMGIDLLPRKLFRYVLLGFEDKVLANSETIYSCLLCRMCEANCPAEVNIAENVRTLRNYINKNVFNI